MKRLYFNRPNNNLDKLHDELLAAIPALAQVQVGRNGLNEALPENMQVEGLGDDIWLTVADDADEALIWAIILTAE